MSKRNGQHTNGKHSLTHSNSNEDEESKATPLSTVERPRKDVSTIARRRLSDLDVYPGSKIYPEILKEHFLLEGRLKEDTALRIIREASAILKKENTVLDLQAPLTICGDIHGQFYDLVHLFDVGGPLPDIKYLFLGEKSD